MSGTAGVDPAALARGQMRVLQLIAEGAALADVLAALMHFVEQLSPGALASVLLLDAEGLHLKHGAAPSLPATFTAAIDGAAIGPAAGSCGTAAHRREAVIVEDIATDPLWADYGALALAHGLRACWSSPIFAPAGGVLGTFAIYRREPGRPGPHERWLIELAAQTAAIAIDRAASQAAQQRTTRRLEDTLQHMDQGVLILDPELRIVYANRRLHELLGYDPGLCAPGTPLVHVARFSAARGDYGPGDAEALALERMQPVLRREPHRWVRELGRQRVVDVRGTPLPDGGFVISYTDLTPRAHSERDAMRFRTALDLSSDGIYLVDALSLELLDCNDGACRALGYTRQELLGHGVERIFADRTREQLQAQYTRLVAGDGAGTNFAALHRRKDGSVFPVEINGRVHHSTQGPLLVGVARDTSEHQRGQAALRRSEEALRLLVESALDAVVRIDTEGIVVGWNAQAERSFGWSAGEAIGRDLNDLIVPERHHEAHARGIRHFLATGEGPALNRRIEMSARCRDGREIPVELSVTPIATADGWLFSAFLRDLTAAKAGESARATLEAQLRESQKMEAIGTLAGGIAHDFNNILAAILGNAELAREALPPEHAARLDLEQIQKSAQRARGLVQQILAFGRRQDQQLQPLALRPLIDDARTMMRALLPARVALDVVAPPTPLWVMADATQLHQVLMNLCTNAWHALQGEAGSIEFGLEDAAAADGSRRAHLWVRDTGCGMDAGTRARIFEPFFTTKAVGHGTGLGLAVVHGIVASHRGSITVESAPGQGSCFHIHLPLCDGAEATAPAPLQGAPARAHGQRVLYIDDDEAMVVLVERLLRRDGYEVRGYTDAAAALACVRAQPRACDIVVTDYNMPQLSGFDVARELARIRPGLPVVVSSGYITEAMRGDAQPASVRALLRKENTLEELSGLVRAVLAQAGDAPR